MFYAVEGQSTLRQSILPGRRGDPDGLVPDHAAKWAVDPLSKPTISHPLTSPQRETRARKPGKR